MAQLICDVTCGSRFSSSTSLTIPRWELRAFSMGVWIGFTAQALNNIHCFYQSYIYIITYILNHQIKSYN